MVGGDILLCDLDAFYASVEQKCNPDLLGKPVIVGGDPKSRGVVSTCSYEARAFGVRSAMPLFMAKQLCPKGIFLPVNMPKYRQESDKVFSIYSSLTPRIEVVSIDEAYLEVKKGEGLEVARLLKAKVKKETGLNVSIGIGSNKLLAKIASELSKPNGLRDIWLENALQELKDQPVKLLPGIGPKTEKTLQTFGIDSIGKLASISREWLLLHFGARGEELYHFARGHDNRPLILERNIKSIGEEITLPFDIEDWKDALPILNNLCEELGYRLRKSGYHAYTLILKVRYGDFNTITRSSTKQQPLSSHRQIYETSLELLNKINVKSSVRLLGVQVTNLYKEEQLCLFQEKDKEESVTAMVDGLKTKYGEKIIKRGVAISRPKENFTNNLD